MESEHKFIFTSLKDSYPTTARKVHIRRLFDLLQLCILRNDMQRAKRTWAILVRCKEVNWIDMWSTSIHLLSEDPDGTNANQPRMDFLRAMMLQNFSNREMILKELVLRLILSNRNKEALDELELYLPSFPYQDNPVLHTYAGLVCVYLAQVGSQEQTSFNQVMLRNAQGHLGRAKVLDPENIVANGFLEEVQALLQGSITQRPHDASSDTEQLPGESEGSCLRKKKVRVHADASP